MWNGGLKKSVSRLALVAAAGVISTSAIAADLGGDCCADLEERVAELEATTARKGTRKVSLTISGQVNKMIMHYNDGGPVSAAGNVAGGNRSSNTFWGIDNTNSSSRFNFTGDAKISPTAKAGFNMTIEVGSGARSVAVSQYRAEAPTVTSHIGTGDLNDHSLFMRDAVVWLESSALGRLTLGRLTQTGPQGTIDLGGIGVIAPGTVLAGNGLMFRNAAGNLVGSHSIGAGFDAAGDYNKRIDGIRYDSPSFAGFQVGASYGEASNTMPYSGAASPIGQDLGNAYAANLRYAGEFSGVRLAAAVGYERVNQDSIVTTARRGTRNTYLGGSLSLMHVPTGLFAQGGYTKIDSDVAGDSRDGAFWHVAAGISQNWFGIGKTSLYGEYGKGSDTFWVNRSAVIAAPAPGMVSTAGVAGDDMRFWGLGIVQNIDAAAMEVYLGYRNFDATIAAQPTTKDIDVIAGGARIKF